MPAIDERARHELFQAVHDRLGPDHADTLMSLLPPVGWADVATNQHVDGQFRELRSDMDHGLAELRTEMDRRFAELRSDMEHGFAELRTEMDRRFAELRSDMEHGLAELRTDLDEFKVSIRREMAELEARMIIRFEKVDERFEALEHKLTAKIEQAQKEIVRTVVFAMVGSLVSMTSLCLAVIVQAG